MRAAGGNLPVAHFPRQEDSEQLRFVAVHCRLNRPSSSIPDTGCRKFLHHSRGHGTPGIGSAMADVACKPLIYDIVPCKRTYSTSLRPVGKFYRHFPGAVVTALRLRYTESTFLCILKVLNPDPRKVGLLLAWLPG